MTNDAVRITWSAVVMASVGVWATSFILVALVIFTYAFGLGWAARGAPDSAAIQEFASSVVPGWGFRLGVALTMVAGFWLARRVSRPVVHGLITGALVAVVPFATRPSASAEALLRFGALMAAGAFGAWLSSKVSGHFGSSNQSRHAV